MEPMNTNRRRMSLALVAVLPAVGTAGVASVFSARAAESPGPLRIDLPRFSTNLPGKRLPAGWAHQTLPSVERRNSFDLLAEDDGSVLRVTVRPRPITRKSDSFGIPHHRRPEL